MLMLSLTASAQLKIGYFSYEAALKSCPKYAEIQESMKTLKAQYAEEMKRSEEEFNAKYEDFLENMDSYATSIRRKRQTELRTMLEANVQFRNESQRLLKQSEQDMMSDLHASVDNTLKAIASQQGFTMIVNTDSDACPYLDPAVSEDINSLVQAQLSAGN